MRPKTNRILILMLVVLALLLPYSAAYAQGPGGDKVVFGDNYTLANGETLDGSLTVMGGNVTLEEGSTVTKDVAVIGGNVSASGAIQGDLVVIGGNVSLKSGAVVEGDVNSIGGNLNRDPGSTIKGEVLHGLQFNGADNANIPWSSFLPFLRLRAPEITQTPSLPRENPGSWLLAYFLHGLSAIAWAALMAVIGVLVAVLLPQHAGRVSTTVHESPLVSFGTGCLTWALGIPILILLAITICLLPLSLIVSLLLVVAGLFGWVAVGWVIGKKALEALRSDNPTPILEVVVGVVLLTLLWQMPRVIPCIGWLFSLGVGVLAGSIGLGAVLLTRFGTRAYPTPPGGPLVPAASAAAPQGGLPPTPPALPEPSLPSLPEHTDPSL